MAKLKESTEDVLKLVTSTAWYVMDDEQRDRMIADVIAKRWQKTTADGVILGGSWWGRALGTDEAVIRRRVERHKARSEATKPPAATPRESHRNHVSSARGAIRRHPELAKELIKDPQVRTEVVRALKETRPLKVPEPATEDERAAYAHAEDVEAAASVTDRDRRRHEATFKHPERPFEEDTREAIGRMRHSIDDLRRAFTLLSQYDGRTLNLFDAESFDLLIGRIGNYHQALAEWRLSRPLDAQLMAFLEEGGEATA